MKDLLSAVVNLLAAPVVMVCTEEVSPRPTPVVLAVMVNVYSAKGTVEYKTMMDAILPTKVILNRWLSIVQQINITYLPRLVNLSVSWSTLTVD